MSKLSSVFISFACGYEYGKKHGSTYISDKIVHDQIIANRSYIFPSISNIVAFKEGYSYGVKRHKAYKL